MRSLWGGIRLLVGWGSWLIDGLGKLSVGGVELGGARVVVLVVSLMGHWGVVSWRRWVMVKGRLLVYIERPFCRRPRS